MLPCAMTESVEEQGTEQAASDGSIRFESEIGVGTTMRVLLPVVRA